MKRTGFGLDRLQAALLLPLLLCVGMAQATISGPDDLSSSSHPINISDNQIKRQITVGWSTAGASPASLSGYYYLFNTEDASSTTLADVLSGTQLGPSATTVTSTQLGDSNSHYFHIVAFDSSGTFGSIQTSGPYVINTTPDVQTVVDGGGDSSGNNDSNQTLTISGSRFMENVSVTVGTSSLQNVTRNNSSQITATLPSGFDAGTHDVKVTNTVVGKSATLSPGYTVTTSNATPTASGKVLGKTAPYSYTKSDSTDTITISLSAADSTDTDGDSLTYTWSVDQSPSDASDSSLSSSSNETPTYATDVAGEYIFGLIVNDGTVSSSKVQVTVTVNDPGNTPPTANAGADQDSIVIGEKATLNGGQSTDAEGTVTYAWEITDKPDGSSALITTSTSVTANLEQIDKVGSYTVQLTVTDESGVEDTDELVVTAGVGTVSTGNTTLVLDATSTEVATSVTATVDPVNANGLAMGAGQTVVFASTLGTVSATSYNDASGTYSATITSTASGVGVVTATVNSTAIDATDSLTFTPAAFSKSVSTITADPAVVDTSDTITISVTPKDAYGNKLGSGQTVVITKSVISGSATVDLNNDKAESNGVYTQTVTVNAPTTGNSYIVEFGATVDSDTIDATDSVTFQSNAPNATKSSVTADATDNLTADNSDTSTVTVTVRDAQSNPLSSKTVTLSFDNEVSGRDIVSAAATTDASGSAQFTVKSTKAGTKTLTATVGTNGDSVTLGSIDITFGAGTATQLNIKSGNSQSGVVGEAVTDALVVNVVDFYSNPVSGAVVDFAVISSEATGTLTDASDTTNASGDASTTLSLATTSGTVEVSATVNGLDVSDSFTITAIAGEADLGSSGNSIITIGDSASSTSLSQTVIIDATTTIWLTLKDQYGNLVGNMDTSGDTLTVEFGQSGTKYGSYSATPTYVEASKAYKTVVTAPSSGGTSDAITAQIDGSPLGRGVTVSYIDGTLDVDRSGGSLGTGTDGIMIIRFMADPQLSSATLTSGMGAAAIANKDEILSRMKGSASIFDVDASGGALSTGVDGIMILRYMADPQLSSSTLTAGMGSVIQSNGSSILNSIKLLDNND